MPPAAPDLAPLLEDAAALYDAAQPDAAVTAWEKIVRLERACAPAWRNLAFAYYNLFRDLSSAKGAFTRALQAAPDDPRLLLERDRLLRFAGETPYQRLTTLQNHPAALIASPAVAALAASVHIQSTHFDEALTVLEPHHPAAQNTAPEIRTQWLSLHLALGRRALWQNDPPLARAFLQTARAALPPSIDPAAPPPRYCELCYWFSTFSAADSEKELPAAAAIHPTHESLWQFESGAPENAFFGALCLRELGQHDLADSAFAALQSESANPPPPAPRRIADFAPLANLPETQIALTARFLAALASYGLRDKPAARRLLSDTLRDDPGFASASDLFLSLDW